MSFDGDTQMGMSLGFEYDPSGADQWMNATTNIIQKTDALAMSQQRLATQSQTMRSSMQSTTTSIQAVSGGLTQNNTLVQNLAGSNERLTGSLANVQMNLDKTMNSGKSFTSVLQANVGQISLAVGALTGLIFSFTQLSRSHFMVERSTVMVEAAQLKVDTITRKLTDTITKYGANSAEAATVQDKLTLAEKRSELSKTRLGLVQTRYNETLIQFGTQLVPTVIGVASGLVQVFSNIQIKAAAAAIATQLFGTALRAALTATGIGIALVGLSFLMDALSRKSTDTKDALVDMADGTGMAMDEAAEDFTAGTEEVKTAAVSMADAIKGMKENIVSGGEDFAAELETIKKNIVSSLTVNTANLPEEGGTSIFDIPKKINDMMQSQPQLFQTPNLPRTATTGGTSTTTGPIAPPHFAAIGPNLPVTGGTQTVQAPNLPATQQNLEGLATTVKKVGDETVTAAQKEETWGNLMRLGNIAFQDRVAEGQKILAQMGTMKPATDQNAASMAELGTRLKEAAASKNAVEFRAIKDEMVSLALQTAFGVTNAEDLAQAWQDAADSPLTNTILATVNGMAVLGKETEKSLDWEKQRAQDIKTTSSALKDNNDLAKQLPESIGKLIGIEKLHSLTMQTKTGVITEYDEALIRQEDMELRVAKAMTDSNSIHIMSKQYIAAVAAQAINLTTTLEDQAVQVQASNLLWAHMSESMKQIIFDAQKATIASIDLTKAISNETYQQYLLNQGQIAGLEATAKWVDSLYEATAAEETQLTMTEAIVGTYMKLPPALILTIENLQALQEEYVRTGDNAKTMDDLMNKAFASSRNALSELVKAAVEGGKKWKEAWKELDLRFIPKSERDETKDFINDLADIQEAATSVAGPLGIYMGMLDAGRITTKDNSKWTKDLTEGMRNLRNELGDIVGMDVAENIFDPLIKFKKDGLTQDEVQIWAAVANEYERLSNLPGAWTDERTSQLEQFTQKLLDQKEALEDLEKAGNKAEESVAGVASIVFGTGGHSVHIKPDKPLTEEEQEKQARDLAGKGIFDLIPRPDDVKQAGDQIQAEADKIVKGMTDAQTAIANMVNEGSNSFSILAKNAKPHVTTIQTYFGTTVPQSMMTSQTAFTTLTTVGSNSMANLVSNIRPHVITLQTYFAKTIPDAIRVASMAMLGFMSLTGGGGGGGGGGFQNIGFLTGMNPMVNPGTQGAIGAAGAAGGDALTRFFANLGIKFPEPNGPILQNPFRDFDWSKLFGSKQAASGMKATDAQVNAAGGFNAAEGGISFKGRDGGVGGGGDPFAQLVAAAGKAQKALANLATQGGNSLSILVNSAKAHVTTLNTYFTRTIPIALAKSQDYIANFANEGGNSLSILVKSAKAHVTTINTYFNKTVPAALAKSQEYFANLANEGGNSLSILIKSAKSHVTTIGTYFNKTVPVALARSQEYFANLANEGSNSLSILSKASSKHMNGVINNANAATDAINELKDAIDSLESKKITITVARKLTGPDISEYIAQGGVFNSFATGGIIDSAEAGRIYKTNGPQLVMIGDNPGGEEIHAMIPLNNPIPTLRSLQKVLGRRGVGRESPESGDGFGSGSSGDSGEGVTVINLNMDGEKMMTWIRRRLGRNRQGR